MQSKNNKVGWLIAALVFFSIDTGLTFFLYGLEGIADLLFHAWVIFDISCGIKAYSDLKKLPELAPEEAPIEEQGESANGNSEPLYTADMSVKHRVLLQTEALGREVIYRRVGKINELIIDGKVYSGFNGIAGELGHVVIEYNGRRCSCGRRGCWEAYSSATALIRMTKEKIEECAASGRKTMMADAPKISGRTAFDAMRAGDEAGKEVHDKYIKYLACGLTNIINIFQPEVLCIGGGVSNERDYLLAPILPVVESEQYGSGCVPSTKIRIAELGNDAGIIGAAFLGI
jgi:hypothetical protein